MHPRRAPHLLVRRAIATGRWLALRCAVLVAFYLLSVNGFINSGLGRRVINAHPEVVQVRYDWAWTIWPGRVNAINAHVVGEDGRVQFEVRADLGIMTFTPGGMFHRTVSGTGIRGRGVSIWIRRRLKEQPTPEALARLPDISYFKSVLLPDPPLPPPPPDDPERGIVSVKLEDCDVQDVREVWVDDVRFQGSVDVKGGFYLHPNRFVEVFPTQLILHTGALTTGGDPIVRDVRGTVSATLERLDLAHVGLDQLSRITANIDLRASIADIRFLNYYLERSKLVTLEDGAGDIELRLGIARGVLQNDSRLELTSPRIVLGIPFFDAVGQGHIELSVDEKEKRTAIAVELGAVELIQRSDHKVRASGKEIRLLGYTSNLDLSRRQELDLRVELPDAHAPDLGFLSNYVPRSLAFRIDHGEGRVHGHFHLSTKKNRADAELTIVGKGLSVENAGEQVRGDATIHGALASLDLTTLDADLSGTSLSLDDVTIAAGTTVTPHWWGRVELDACEVHPDRQVIWDSKVHFVIKDLKPVIKVIAANVKLPAITGALNLLTSLRGGAHVEWSESAVSLHHIAVDSGAVSVKGDVRVADLKKIPRSDGALLIKLGLLVVGLDIEDSNNKVVLFRPEKWFDDRVVAEAGAAGEK